MKIIEENLEGSFLTVLVEIPLRRTVAEKIKFINSGDIVNLLGSKYEITGVVKSNRLSNSMRGGGKQKGSWVFQVKQQPKRKPRARKQPAAKKPTPSRKTSPATKKTEVSTPQPKKTSTKPSIRGRMSKIAKEKLPNKKE